MKAIIPAAGLGTRFLPATKCTPKELLPVLDKPVIQYVVEEALEPEGVDGVVIVNSHEKPQIEQYFSVDHTFESMLRKRGKTAEAARVHEASTLPVSFVYQDEARGLGHAVLQAADEIDRESFFVLLGDYFVPDRKMCVRMAEVSREHNGASVIAVAPVPADQVRRYGVIVSSGSRRGLLLPNLEGELSELERQLQEVSAAEDQLSQARSQARQLEGREAALTEELAQHDRWESARKRQALTQAETAAREAEEHAVSVRRQLETEQIPGNDTIGRLRGAIVNLETVRKSVDKARGERDEAMKALLRAEAAVNENPFAGQTAEQAWKSATSISDSKPRPLSELLPSIFLGIFTLVFYAAQILGMGDGFVDALWGIPCALAALLIPFYKNRKWKQETAAALKKHNVSSAAELREEAVAYADLLKAQEAAQANASAKAATADALYASLTSNEQGILLEVRRFAPAAYDIPTADALLRQCAVRRRELQEAEAAAREARMRSDLQAQEAPQAPEDLEAQPPARSREAVSGELDAVRAALAQARSAADRLTGQLHTLGDPGALRERRARLEEQRVQLEGEYEAIRMAMETLESANTTLQNRFSPALGRRAAEIFRQLTGGRYEGVVLDRQFRLSAEPAGDGVYRDAQLLSAGALDQLYLAVRLAICQLVLPQEREVPMVLDDALANFDDARCAAALDYLTREAQNRQILLFTCHSREADFLENRPEVAVWRLTEAL